MKRFLMLLAVAAVAGAMYAAEAIGSQQAKGPSARQFAALKKEVTQLKTQLGAVKKTANGAAGFIAVCLTSSKAGVAPVNDFGDASATPTFGYHYLSSAGGTEGFTTALDIDSSPTPGAFFQAVDPGCVGPAAASRAQTHSGSRLPLRAEHTP